MSRELQDILSNGEITGIRMATSYSPSNDHDLVTVKFTNTLPISAPVQDALDLKMDKAQSDLVKFNPNTPTYTDGNLYYHATCKCLTFTNDIEDTALNIGEEIRGRYINRTGATITNGTVLRYDGFDATSGRPKLAPALADTFLHALVVGFATHDCLNDEEGYAVNMGSVKGIDTSTVGVDDILYLSDTVAGGFQSTAPDIASRLGRVFISDAVNGEVFAMIESNVDFPTLVGQLYGTAQLEATSDQITTTYKDIVQYSGGLDSGLNVNVTTGEVQAAGTGLFRVSVNLTITVPSSSQTRTLTVQLWCQNDSHEEVVSSITIAKDATQVSRSFSRIYTAQNLHQFVVRLKADTTISGVTFDQVTFDLETVHVRS